MRGWPSRTRGVPEAAQPWLFIAPALIAYGAIVVYPTIYSMWLSLHAWDGMRPTMRFVGLANYVDLFVGDRVFKVALRNTAIWAVASLLLPTGIGLGLALLLNRPFRGRVFFRAVFYLPSILSLSLTGLIWSWMYHPTLGLLNQLLEAIGAGRFAVAWLSDPSIALYPVIVAAAWHNAGLPMLLYLAGLQSVPEEAIEAARVDGASRWQVLWHVTLPLLRETHLVVFAIMMINALKVYDIIYVMTAGGPANQTQMLATWMYALTFSFNRIGPGTAIAVLLFGLTLVFAIPYLRSMARRPV